jgi:hypothetical protein
LNEGNAEWETTRYAGVEHSFTVWGDGGYSAVADHRSWQSMKHVFEEMLAVPSKSGNEGDLNIDSNDGISYNAVSFASGWSCIVISTGVVATGLY